MDNELQERGWELERVKRQNISASGMGMHSPQGEHNPIRCQKECFSAPFLVAQHSSASKRMFFCTKNHPRQNLVPNWGIFCTISCGAAQFGVKKNVFLHRKSSQAELGDKMGHFLHHFLWRSTVRRQKECFSAPKIIPGKTWYQNGHFSAPFLVARHSLVPKWGIFCTKNHPRQKLVRKMGIFSAKKCQKSPKTANNHK